MSVSIFLGLICVQLYVLVVRITQIGIGTSASLSSLSPLRRHSLTLSLQFFSVSIGLNNLYVARYCSTSMSPPPPLNLRQKKRLYEEELQSTAESHPMVKHCRFYLLSLCVLLSGTLYFYKYICMYLGFYDLYDWIKQQTSILLESGRYPCKYPTVDVVVGRQQCLGSVIPVESVGCHVLTLLRYPVNQVQEAMCLSLATPDECICSHLLNGRF